MKIFNGIKYRILNDVELNRNYDGIEYDSRKIKKNFIFVALTGNNVDGHNYIDKAVENGATCIITSKEVEIKHNVSYVLVENLRSNLGFIASNFYEWPQRKLIVVGVTGTNGKTSSTYMIEKILNKRITRIGTINYQIGEKIFETKNTTPESLDLIKIFAQTLKEGIKYVVMEVSSHALELGRVEAIDYDFALFTNLTQDHLDYHKNMENYFNAKRKLFLKLKDKENSVINVDDEYGQKLYEEFSLKNKKILSYGLKNGKIRAKFLKNNCIEINYEDIVKNVEYNLLGDFNLYNTLGAISVCLKMGISLEEIEKRIKLLIPAPGRFENIDCGQKYKVIIDYAHTPDALKNIIIAAKKIKDIKRTITIFGCGGDRDRTKRPIMASIAEGNSDIVILTSDNPRTEDPNQIFADVKKGFKNLEQIIFEPDREKAIKIAIEIAKENDIVLVTGKGHETYHIIGTKKFHFDDKEIICREIILQKRRKNDN